MKPDYNLEIVSVSLLRKQIEYIINLIITPTNPSRENPYPFSSRLKEVLKQTIRDLVRGLSDCMTGGVNDVVRALKFWMTLKLNINESPFYQMLINMLISFILSTLDNTNNDNTTETNIITNTPSNFDITDIPVEWRDIITNDIIRQQGVSESPLSEHYLSGSNPSLK